MGSIDALEADNLGSIPARCKLFLFFHPQIYGFQNRLTIFSVTIDLRIKLARGLGQFFTAVRSSPFSQKSEEQYLRNRQKSVKPTIIGIILSGRLDSNENMITRQLYR